MKDNNMNFSIIVAVDENNGIGRQGDLPWNLKEDMRYFSNTTKSTEDPNKKNVVIMGRKTYESIPAKFRPLPGRHNIVISRNEHYDVGNKNVILATSLNDALSKINKMPDYENVFVIGGAQIYNEAFEHPALNCVHLTKVFLNANCDTFIKYNICEKMKEINCTFFKQENISYKISVYKK